MGAYGPLDKNDEMLEMGGIQKEARRAPVELEEVGTFTV
jgi:hypothetical protein